VFKRFACLKAREFYAEPAPLAGDTVVIVESAWDVPATYKNADAEVIPMYAGMTVPYSIKNQVL
jgi:dihydroorotase